MVNDCKCYTLLIVLIEFLRLSNGESAQRDTTMALLEKSEANLLARDLPMPPKLNAKRAQFVLTKIDQILAWEQRKESDAIPISSNWDAISAKCVPGSTGGWRT